jgi:hypothetical protein
MNRYFWNHVTKTDTCWLWTGYTNAKGYGRVFSDGANRYAHRVAYEAEFGPIPPDSGERMTLDHLCRVPNCVRPDHLEFVSHSENIRRGRNVWREKTHCPAGHEYTPENTGVRPNGHRWCRECNRTRWRSTWHPDSPPASER